MQRARGPCGPLRDPLPPGRAATSVGPLSRSGRVPRRPTSHFPSDSHRLGAPSAAKSGRRAPSSGGGGEGPARTTKPRVPGVEGFWSPPAEGGLNQEREPLRAAPSLFGCGVARCPPNFPDPPACPIPSPRLLFHWGPRLRLSLRTCASIYAANGAGLGEQTQVELGCHDPARLH